MHAQTKRRHFLRETLTHCGVPTVVVLDSFELFASRPKQTILYNLFTLATEGGARLDASSSESGAAAASSSTVGRLALAVVGLSRRIDAVESLEKRIKSRFAHRQLLISPPRWPTVVAMARDALLAPCRSLWATASSEGRATLTTYALLQCPWTSIFHHVTPPTRTRAHTHTYSLSLSHTHTHTGTPPPSTPRLGSSQSMEAPRRRAARGSIRKRN
jgi:hypothetical protein